MKIIRTKTDYQVPSDSVGAKILFFQAMEDSVQNSEILDKNFNVKENLESTVEASEAEVTEGCTGMETFEGLILKT